MTLNLGDTKLAEQMLAKFKNGFKCVPKFIDGKLKYFFEIGRQPKIKFKGKSFGQVLYVESDGSSTCLELEDGKAVNYLFNADYKKFVTLK